MAGASALGVYNVALRHLGERKLASPSENRESRRYLDDEWDAAVLQCLSRGFWNFALRTDQIPAETTLTPAFGYQYAFAKPTDWIRTFLIADNDTFNPDLRRFHDENGYWFADISPLYVRYVSSDPNRGLAMSLWTPGFVEYLGAYLAHTIAPRITQDEAKITRIEKAADRLLNQGLARDAMDLPPGETPYGTWVMSRAPRGSMRAVGPMWGD